MYREYLPHILLLPYIDKYWVSQAVVPGQFSFKVFPDGCVDIIFAFGNSARTRSMQECHPYIVGTMTGAIEQCFTDQVDMFGIRFKPGGITAFTRTPIYEFVNMHIDLTLIDSLFDTDFYHPLQATKNIDEQLQYIDNYLLGKLSSLLTTEKRILHAIQLVAQYKGTLPVRQIADNVCLGTRQFERLFKTTIGIPAKSYSRIVRFNHTRQHLQNNPTDSLFSIAADCGYYDHAHLIKEFEQLSGETPSFFAGKH